MATETSTDKAADAATEAKGLAEQFLQTLGLVDLIIGALTLYWLRLCVGKNITRVLESTGHSWLDVALLACAAALVGKIVSTIADLLAGLRDSFRSDESYKRLNDAIRDFRTVLGDNSSMDGVDPIDQASRYVVNSNPRLQSELEAIYNATVIAYSMSFLALLFGIYFGSKRVELADVGPPVLFVIIPVILAAAFVIYGLLKQSDYIDTLTDHLNYAASKLTHEKQRLAEPGNNRQITVVPAQLPPISIELSGKNISVELLQVKQKEDL